MPSTLVALHGVLFTLRWRRIVRLSSAISLTGAPFICRKRFVWGAKDPWSRQFAGGIGWWWGRLLQSLPSLCRRVSSLHFVVSIYLCHPSHLVSTGHVNHPPLLFSTSIALGICSYLAWLDSISVCRNYLVSWNCLCSRCQLLPRKGEACTMSGRASPKSLH